MEKNINGNSRPTSSATQLSMSAVSIAGYKIFEWNYSQACRILTICSNRESGDSTRTSRKTIVSIGSIGSSRDVVFFSEIK